MSTTSETKTAVQQPQFTTREDDTGVHLQIALPGVKKEDLKLTLNQSVLQIEATRTNVVQEDWKTHSATPKTVAFQLNARLTDKLDGTNVNASLENGILTLDIPIREEAKPRQIYVN